MGNRRGEDMQRVQHARGSSFLPKLTFVITLVLITGATTYKIYPHWTLNSVFGTTDQSGVTPLSDTILIQNPLTQGFTTYFYATASKSFPTAGWKQAGQGNTDFGQTPLYNDQGVL